MITPGIDHQISSAVGNMDCQLTKDWSRESELKTCRDEHWRSSQQMLPDEFLPRSCCMIWPMENLVKNNFLNFNIFLILLYTIKCCLISCFKRFFWHSITHPKISFLLFSDQIRRIKLLIHLPTRHEITIGGQFENQPKTYFSVHEGGLPMIQQ